MPSPATLAGAREEVVPQAEVEQEHEERQADGAVAEVRELRERAAAESLEDKARCVIAAGAEGLLGPDEVDRWLATLANAAKIIEATLLEKRIAELERQLGLTRAGAALDIEPLDDERPLV